MFDLWVIRLQVIDQRVERRKSIFEDGQIDPPKDAHADGQRFRGNATVSLQDLGEDRVIVVEGFEWNHSGSCGCACVRI